MKIKKTKKKQKGVRYIAKVLQKYGGKKYKNYTNALEKARSVLAQIKEKGEKVKVTTVLDKSRKHRAKKQVVKPELYYKLQTPEPYFSLVDYPNWINNTTSEITFTSEIFNQDIEEIQGGTKPTFNATFSSFVGFLNKKVLDRNEAYDYRVICTPPEFDKDTKKWISRIISIDPNGDEDNYDFTPYGAPPSIVPQKKGKEPKKPKQEKRTKSDEEIIKELDLKLLKEKSRQQANEMFLKGLLTKKEYKDEIDRINNL